MAMAHSATNGNVTQPPATPLPPHAPASALVAGHPLFSSALRACSLTGPRQAPPWAGGFAAWWCCQHRVWAPGRHWRQGSYPCWAQVAHPSGRACSSEHERWGCPLVGCVPMPHVLNPTKGPKQAVRWCGAVCGPHACAVQMWSA